VSPHVWRNLAWPFARPLCCSPLADRCEYAPRSRLARRAKTGVILHQRFGDSRQKPGNSLQIIFQHYRELVRLKETKEWFAIVPSGRGKVIGMRKAA